MLKKPKASKGKKQRERKQKDNDIEAIPGPSWAHDEFPPIPQGDKSYDTNKIPPIPQGDKSYDNNKIPPVPQGDKSDDTSNSSEEDEEVYEATPEESWATKTSRRTKREQKPPGEC